MDTFMKYYQAGTVLTFFSGMQRYLSKETMDSFANYHTEEVLNDLVVMFPPPSIYELWNRWLFLGRPV